MEDFYSILLIFGLILLNGSFVAGEFAIARLRKTRIDHIASGDDETVSKSKVQTAKLLQKMVANMNDYISACQVGITIASLALGAVAEAKIEAMISPVIEQMDLPLDPHAVSILLALNIITFFHVILGEVVPKNLAIIDPEKIGFGLARYLRFLYMLFKVPVIILNFCSNQVLKVLGIEANFDDAHHSEAELKMILSSSQAQGVLEEEEAQLMQSIFDFNDRVAKDVMVPRSDMFCISGDLTIGEAGMAAARTGFSRFPVFQGRIDNVVGYFTLKDILDSYHKGSKEDNIKTVLSDVLKVSDAMYVIDLLKLMQENKKQIAILIDEFGGVTGLATAEDIVEEIFGEIEDEDVDQEIEYQKFERLANGDVVIDGLTKLDEVNDEIGTKLKSQHFDTIGGFVFGLIGTEPKVGDEVNFGKIKFKIESHMNNRVKKVRVLAGSK